MTAKILRDSLTVVMGFLPIEGWIFSLILPRLIPWIMVITWDGG